MAKKLIIHDLSNEEAEKVFHNYTENFTIFSATPTVNYCLGCFGCWVKSPGKCVINDRCSATCESMHNYDEMIVVSRLLFGGLSSDIKAIFDRSIGNILPFFRYLNNEMHHIPRYKNFPNLHYIFYSKNMTSGEKQTAEKLVVANALNLGITNYSVTFYNSPLEIEVAK